MKKKELVQWVELEIKNIEDDERFNYERADLSSNLPLAMVQLSFDTRLRTLKQFKEKLEEGE